MEGGVALDFSAAGFDLSLVEFRCLTALRSGKSSTTQCVGFRKETHSFDRIPYWAGRKHLVELSWQDRPMLPTRPLAGVFEMPPEHEFNLDRREGSPWKSMCD